MDKLIEAAQHVVDEMERGYPILGPVCRLKEALAAVRAHDAGTDEAKHLSELLCPPHAGLDKSGKLEPFDNCIACIRNERDELKSLLMRISTDCAQTALEDPLRAKDNWVLLSTPVREEIAWRSGEYARQSPASHAAEMDEGLAQTNRAPTEYRPGLDQVIDQRNRIVAREIPDPACSGMRDDIVLAFDILLEVLGEHFPLMGDTKGEASHAAESASTAPLNAADQSARNAGCNCSRKIPYLDFSHEKTCPLYSWTCGSSTAQLDAEDQHRATEPVTGEPTAWSAQDHTEEYVQQGYITEPVEDVRKSDAVERRTK